jgi:hypothetical protein
MTEQARFDVGQRQRLAQQRVGIEIDLPDREIVRRAPPSVELAQAVRVKRLVSHGHGLIPEWAVRK